MIVLKMSKIDEKNPLQGESASRPEDSPSAGRGANVARRSGSRLLHVDRHDVRLVLAQGRDARDRQVFAR